MHAIRLRGPWNVQSLDGEQGRRPFDWNTELGDVLRAAAAGETLVLSRNFGLPTGLAASDRVQLVIAVLRPLEVRLNGMVLSSAIDGDVNRNDINSLMQLRNGLEIEWKRTKDDLSCDHPEMAEIRLEIIVPGAQP